MIITAGRNTKLVENCTGHRTKAEKESRTIAEKNLQTGYGFREHQQVKKKEVAHKLFLRIQKNFKAIQKNDAAFEQVINRYCIITAECYELESLYDNIMNDIDKTESKMDEMKFETFIELKNSLYGNLYGIEKRINRKRDMLFAIEKDNLMTIQGMLRAVPKKAVDDVDDPFDNLLARQEERRGKICQFPQSQ